MRPSPCGVRATLQAPPAANQPADGDDGLFVERVGVIGAALAGYWNSATFSDLTVLTPDNRRLLCHRVVLSAGSRRFAKILEQPGVFAFILRMPCACVLPT